jgi:predicted membrane-bound spermidine synthase
VFMAGLAMGALLTSRLLPGVQRRALTPALSHPMGEGGPALAGSGEGRFLEDGRRLLVFLAMAIAGFALLLPLVLPLLGAMGGTTASLFLVKGVIALLTFLLAALVGMQFPLANRLEFDGTVAGVSRLYTADLIGACLGALLTSTLLLPLMGLAGVCLLTAALNFVAGGMMQFRKNVT